MYIRKKFTNESKGKPEQKFDAISKYPSKYVKKGFVPEEVSSQPQSSSKT
jgi:hypothetical protein